MTAKVVSGAARVKVWDPWVRIGHWLLVAGYIIAYVTAEERLTLHVWAGYGVGAIVAFRILWGFIGPEYARFTNFVYGPRTVFRYTLGLFSRRAPRYLGHSPAGGTMVILLLLGLAATTWSGLTVYAYDQQRGPLAGWVANAAATSSAESFEAREEYWEETHELIVNLTLLLALLHVGGVVLASFAHRENLVAAMITGNKRPTGDD